ncbi:hypothetical protein Tco_0007039 [Tanacetum coccineum]
MNVDHVGLGCCELQHLIVKYQRPDTYSAAEPFWGVQIGIQEPRVSHRRIPYGGGCPTLLEQRPVLQTEDEATTTPLPPFFLSLRIRPPHTRVAMRQMRAAAPSTYHSLLPSGTPPLLPIPLPTPSTNRRADIPEADTPPRKRLLLTTPRPGCEVGESFVAAAARQPGPTKAHRVDCSLVDTMETRFRDTERRMMTALEMVNMRVSYQVDVHSRESSEFYTRHHDAQKDRAAVRAEIEVLRRERLAYGNEALEARVTVLETEVRRLVWLTSGQPDDLGVRHIMRTWPGDGATHYTLEDTGSAVLALVMIMFPEETGPKLKGVWSWDCTTDLLKTAEALATLPRTVGGPATANNNNNNRNNNTRTSATTTTREPKGQIPMPSFTLSVGLQATLRRTAPSGRTRTREMATL